MTILDIGIIATLLVAAVADLFYACIRGPARPEPRAPPRPVQLQRPMRR